MVFELLGLGFVLLSAVVAYKLWKANKVVTAGTVLAGDKTVVEATANTAETAVANTIVSKL